MSVHCLPQGEPEKGRWVSGPLSWQLPLLFRMWYAEKTAPTVHRGKAMPLGAGAQPSLPVSEAAPAGGPWRREGGRGQAYSAVLLLSPCSLCLPGPLPFASFHGEMGSGPALGRPARDTNVVFKSIYRKF